jgi:hypothetical protein
VISFSHFLPHRALRWSPYVAELGKAVGCEALQSVMALVGAWH